MNCYETLYIVHSALEAGRLKDIVVSVEDLLKENGAEILATEIWGKKKLGYFIDKQKYGTYILVQFKSDGSKNNNFNLEMEHNPSILAYMTVRIEEGDIIEQTEDLDTQIAGKNVKSNDENNKPVIEKKDNTEINNKNGLEEESSDVKTVDVKSESIEEKVEE